MQPAQALDFYDESALLERLSRGLKKRSQEVVFLVGAPLSSPSAPGSPGVPGVDGIIELIRAEFSDDESQLFALNKTLEAAGHKKYQAAFQFLIGRRGQQTANEIVRKAVLAARVPEMIFGDQGTEPQGVIDETWRLMDQDSSGWILNPGTENLGKLVVGYPGFFGSCVLTTNFDPLIEVAIQRAGGHHFRTTLHADGNIAQTQGPGCHVVHLHGYWHGSDTLHTTRQLAHQRPQLRASLSSLLRQRVVVACAYGGWDDAFTDALVDVARDETAYPEVLWTFHTAAPTIDEHLSSRLTPGIDRGRIGLYSGIDCNRLFPKLYELWLSLDSAALPPTVTRSNPVHVTDNLRKQVESSRAEPVILEGDDEDRPPVVDICVGRDAELSAIKQSAASVIFLTGIGGQGKSTLAAEYFAECQRNQKFSFYVWRDCKEEGDRFETQVASVIEKLSHGQISGEALAKQNAGSVITILIGLIRELEVLFVFDNADHYVNLESGRMAGSANTFVEALLGSKSPSRAVFTCRPFVAYEDVRILSFRLDGLTLDASVTLFGERGAPSERSAIAEAHVLTEGHAFWLDLLAIQVARRASSTDLLSLLNEIRRGKGLLPDKTLNSIWTTLASREQTMLRAMAETVKPETELEITEYVRHDLSYNKAIKALNMLRSLNLVVVKRRHSTPDVLELHPLVLQFIRKRFTLRERSSFVKAIIRVYNHFIGNHKSQLFERPSLSILQYWTQQAELHVAAADYNGAFRVLDDVAESFASSAYPREFCRVTRLLLSKVDWISNHRKFKAFEDVFEAHLEILSHLGEYSEVDSLLEKYERTVVEKDARYIHYCGMKCHAKWARGEFSEAVEWGERGRQLKDRSGVDTKFEVAHTLALAKRDAGEPESALPTFLEGRELHEVTNPDELDEDRGGDHYGNVGRCLHFMGRIDEALVCYQKSALLIERDPKREHALNQGYIRTWIGELFVARQQFGLAEVFLRAANLKWSQASPPKAARAMLLARQVRARIPNVNTPDDSKVERICREWILGRNIDMEFR